MEIGGAYPMLCAFFDDAGRLRREAITRQIGAALASGAVALQPLNNFLLYGKLIAADRLGLAPSGNRIPCEIATPNGIAWAKRFAAEPGRLPA